MVNLTAVVAYDQEYGIARQGKIPWDLPLDKAMLQDLIRNLPLVAGRKTADKLKLPRPDGIVYALTHRPIPPKEGAFYSSSVSEILDKLKDEQDVILFGGESVYQAFLPHCNTVIATEIDGRFGCDRFFPELDPRGWSDKLLLRWEKDEFHEFSFKVKIYERTSSQKS